MSSRRYRSGRRHRNLEAPGDSGLVDYLNVIRGHIDTDPGLTDVIPIQGMANSPHLDFAGEIRAATNFPVFHAGENTLTSPPLATPSQPARSTWSA
jgi:2,4-dienoyl-CoA reductase-like NADH-dependent reductase (Old Yellow Enzyme family)